MGKHLKNRIVCYALAFCLLLSLLPAQVFAAREEPMEEAAEEDAARLFQCLHWRYWDCFLSDAENKTKRHLMKKYKYKT